jgi:uncharacterized protein (DUF2126 family)/transglutaminase-like putative cysteine protease
MKVEPSDHFCNWQQDPQGNFIARLVFPKQTRKFSVVVDLVADMTVINPFDFFLEEYAEKFPFAYEPWLLKELAPFLAVDKPGPKLAMWLAEVPREKMKSIDLLVWLNRRLQSDIAYTIRMEPGVQSPEETLEKRTGSCRDSAWLLVTIARHLGLAARFASGYLIQLTADQKSLDGPSGPEQDFTDLHAWTEIYLPGAGWVGLDPTSGLLCGEGHLPVACTPDPQSAAPITGLVERAECQFEFSMKVMRIHEDPRTTKPYTTAQWEQIDQLGLKIDRRLEEDDVRLTMGGEPTFVSIDDMEGAEWNSAAVGPQKRKLSADLIKRLRRRFGPGGLLHYGQGKWYPGESLPRWALACMWRTDGHPLWNDDSLIADESRNYGFTYHHAKKFTKALAVKLKVDPTWMMPAYEDMYYYLWKEQRLPFNVDPRDPKIEDPEERSRLARVFNRGIGSPVGIVLPLARQWQQGGWIWKSGHWPVRSEKLMLLPGDSPVGLRLPLDSLPVLPAGVPSLWAPDDPWSPKQPLPMREAVMQSLGKAKSDPAVEAKKLSGVSEDDLEHDDDLLEKRREKVADVVRTAFCIEPRDGKLYIFMPPVERPDDYVELLYVIEETARELQYPVVIEGYLPPNDWRVQKILVTPDPGVIEVNVQPAKNWREMVDITEGLYEEARLTRLGTEKFDLDGRHTGTGGGNHIVLGGARPIDSPFLRRPDLLRSIIAFWMNHPSLSYLFSNRFIGPTSQAPRADEGRMDSVYELQTALDQIPPAGSDCPPWLVDRLLRNLLIDVTGNTHRSEICIDKLFSPDSSSGRLGLVELRAFEMPPHAQMSLAMQLLVRSLVAYFWRKPYQEPLARWRTELHDRFMLPYFIWRDFEGVIGELQRAGWEWDINWFLPHFEFRMPRMGEVMHGGVRIELRQAIEPWYVLGEEGNSAGTVRYVDSSVERLQVLVEGYEPHRYQLTCNGIEIPLHATDRPGQYVGGVRYRAWQPPSCLHPNIPVHTPLVLDLVDRRSARSIGGCTYYVAHPGGRNYATFPINAMEAESRRAARFSKFGHSPGDMICRLPIPNPDFPYTLDLRRERF